MTQGNITDQDLDELVERCREAAVHFIRGEMHDYLRTDPPLRRLHADASDRR